LTGGKNGEWQKKWGAEKFQRMRIAWENLSAPNFLASISDCLKCVGALHARRIEAAKLAGSFLRTVTWAAVVKGAL
jgi:hypothetical protein